MSPEETVFARNAVPRRAERNPKVRGSHFALLLLALAGCAQRRPDAPYVADRTPLSLDARHHGERELRRMLDDRPPMGEHIREGDAVWEWAVGMFAGRGNDRAVRWSPVPPLAGFDADCTMPRDGSPAVIRVRAEPADAELLWIRAAYELHNSQNSANASRLDRAAMDGSIGRDAYVEGAARSEYVALGRTWDFYRAVWCPWAKERGLPTDRRKWPYRLRASYEAWIARYKDPDGYPWNPMGLHHDRIAGTGARTGPTAAGDAAVAR